MRLRQSNGKSSVGAVQEELAPVIRHHIDKQNCNDHSFDPCEHEFQVDSFKYISYYFAHKAKEISVDEYHSEGTRNEVVSCYHNTNEENLRCGELLSYLAQFLSHLYTS